MATLVAFLTRPATAEPWSIEPLVGVSGEYDSNPLLREFDFNAEEHIAALVDLPVRYDADGFEYVFRPSGRFSNSAGYSSLASNYLHADSDVQFSGDRDTATLQAGMARDSSL